MSRQESDREDLMHEASAFVRRAEWRVTFQADSVVAGFKRNGHWSVYFGADPVYQFDEHGRLRRAFAHGVLWRTQGNTLSRLQRDRTNVETALLRHDLDAAGLKRFLDDARNRLTMFLIAMQRQEATLLRHVPAVDDLTTDIVSALQLALFAEIRLAPAIPGKS